MLCIISLLLLVVFVIFYFIFRLFSDQCYLLFAIPNLLHMYELSLVFYLNARILFAVLNFVQYF